MRVTSRRKATITFLILGVSLASIAVAVGFGWIIINWREGVKVLLGIIFFGAISAGLILNTIFLVREIKRNEQHDSFINAVTHELKTPIASIRLYLQTMQRREVDEAKRHEFYRLMLDDTDRLMNTVEQVLKAGEAGHRRPLHNPVQLDLSEMVTECVDLARVRHNLPPEAMRYRHAGRVDVTGDADELRTAVSNLLDNAVKYSTDPIDIEVNVSNPEPWRVHVSVRDHGVGMPAHELKRIFKRFYRVPNRSSRVKGTGLGLFIVKAIAKKHGGRVFAESEGLGKGSNFTLELPRQPETRMVRV